MLKFPGVADDLLSSMRELSDYIQKAVDKYGQEEMWADSVSGEPIVGDVGSAIVRTNTQKALNGVAERLRLVAAHNPAPDRADMLKLLDDPLTPETRATRRNIGAISALALLIGVGGRSPETFLGLSLKGFPSWIFPALVGVVLCYEFFAFSLYAGTDVARRAIHERRALAYRDGLKAAFGHFATLPPLLERMFARLEAPESEAARKTTKELSAYLLAHWSAQLTKFGAEFDLQKRRHAWDVRLPTLMFAASVVALLSMFRVICQR